VLRQYRRINGNQRAVNAYSCFALTFEFKAAFARMKMRQGLASVEPFGIFTDNRTLYRISLQVVSLIVLEPEYFPGMNTRQVSAGISFLPDVFPDRTPCLPVTLKVIIHDSASRLSDILAIGSAPQTRSCR
jgi:hypothetical protein